MIYPFRFEQWYPADDGKDYTSEERMTVPMVIGLMSTDGSGKQPVIEEMYNDIVNGVVDGAYQMAANTGNVPPVVFLYAGQVLSHNDAMAAYREDIGKALDRECAASDKMEALTELANTNEGSTAYSKGTALKELCERVRRKTGIDYNPELIIDVLRENMKNCSAFSGGARKELKALSEEELIRLTGAVKLRMLTGTSENRLLDELIRLYGMERVQNDVAWELADRRFFSRVRASRR